MEAIALPSGKCSHFLVLVTTREVKAAQVSTRVHLSPSHKDEVLPFGEVLPDAFFRIYILMSLVYISDFYGIPYEEFSIVGFFFAHDHTEDGGLTRSIRAYYPYDSRLREYKVQVVVQELISESLAYMASFYHIGTQARSIRDIYFEFFFQLFLVFAEQAVIVL